LKHSGHKARRLIGRLSFKDPFMCSKLGWTLGLNFTEHS
jgi:hypothetical protein